MNYNIKQMKLKVCNKCKRELPADLKHFRRHSQTKDGLRNPCKECMGYKFSIDHTKGRLTKNKGYKLCKGCLHEFPSDKEHFQEDVRTTDGLTGKCRDCLREDKKKHPSRSKKYIRNHNRKHYKENKEFVDESNKKYYKNNKERMLLFYRIYLQKRRAKKKKLEHSLTEEEWELILKNFDSECAYCGSKEMIEQDHFIPVKQGGGYTKENIIPACRSCNASKSNNDFSIWYKEHKNYSSERENRILSYFENITSFF